MKVGAGEIDGIPAQIVGFGCLIATFVEICTYFLTAKRFMFREPQRFLGYFEIHCPISYLIIHLVSMVYGSVPENRCHQTPLRNPFFSRLMMAGEQYSQYVTFKISVT